MKGRWVIAKVVNNEVFESARPDGPPTHAAQITFKLIETYRWNGKKIGKIFTSLTDKNPYRFARFADAAQVEGLVEFPNKYWLGRYCKIRIIEEEYLDTTRLYVQDFRPINEPLDLTPKPDEPEVEYTTEGLAKLRKVDLIEEVLYLRSGKEYDD